MTNREFYLSDNGIKLHVKLDVPQSVQEKNEGEFKLPLVIIVHGFTGHMEEDHLMAVRNILLEHDFMTLRVDMFGHGESDGEFRDHNLLIWQQNLLTVVDYAKSLPYVSNLYLTGHSQGGLATVLVGALKASDFKAILPMAPAVHVKQAALSGELFDTPFDPKHIPDEIHMSNGRWLSGNYLRVNQMLPIEQAIASYEGPVLVIHSDTDETVPYGITKEMVSAYKNMRFATVHGSDHCFRGHLDEVTKPFIEFILEQER